MSQEQSQRVPQQGNGHNEDSTSTPSYEDLPVDQLIGLLRKKIDEDKRISNNIKTDIAIIYWKTKLLTENEQAKDLEIERLKTDNSRLIQLLAQNNSKMENTNRTYAGALKKTTTEHIVQIYPKQHEVNSPEATKQLLKTKIPLLDSICVDSIKKSKSNGVTVKCRNAADAAKLCQTAEVNGFEANVPEKRNQVCTLLIRGRDINEDIAENIIKKNPHLPNNEQKLKILNCAQIVATTTNSRLSATGKSNRLIIGRLIQSARVGFKPSRTLALSIMPINAQPSTRSTNTKVVQQNLNRNTTATNQLIKDLSSNKYDIAVIQEPHTYTKSDRHHVSSISSYTTFYTNDTSRPRAAIIAANHLSPVFLLQYSTVDTCVVSIQINQQKIVIVNTYFPPDAPIAQCLNHLESIVQSFNEDLLICGDFNSHNRRWHSDKTNVRGRKLAEFIDSNDLCIINNDREPTFYTTRDGKLLKSHIDLTLITPGLERILTERTIITDEMISDHRPIEYKFNTLVNLNQMNTTTRRFATKNVDWTKFKTSIHIRYDSMIEKLNNAQSSNEIEQAAENIIENIVASCEQSLPQLENKRRIVPWWTPELTRLRETMRRWARRLKRTKSLALRTEYHKTWKRHRDEYEREMQSSKRKSWRDNLALQTKETLWSRHYRLCKNTSAQPPSTVQTNNGQFTRNAKETSEYLLNKFLPDDNPLSDNNYHKRIREVANADNGGTNMDALFSQEEMQQAIEDMNDKKAPGEDGISANVLKHFSATAPNVFLKLYNLCLEHSYFPKIFKQSIIKAIPKQGGSNATGPKAWRPISLLPVPGKVLERLMIDRINFNLRTRKLLSSKQYGFTPCRSTIDAVRKVTTTIRKVRDTKQFGVIISLDITGAFDNFWWPAIIARLKHLQVPDNLRGLCKSYLSNRSAKLTIGSSTATKEITRGCPQGATCSPGLWNILYDELLETNLPEGCEMVAFADDLLLMCHNKRPNILETRTNEAIRIICKWGRRVKVSFNETKTRIMIICRKRKQPDLNIRMNRKKLKAVDHFKYLGIHIDSKLKWKIHIEELQAKTNRIFQQLYSMTRNTWGLKSDVIQHIYKMAIEPLITYGAEIWSEEALKRKYNVKALRQMQRGFLLRICRAYRTTSYEALCTLAATTPIELRLQELSELGMVKNTGKFFDTEIERKQLQTLHPATQIHKFVRLPNRRLEHHIPDWATSVCYTDGSRTETHTGSGFVAYQNSETVHTGQFLLPRACCNFQAELIAIKKCLEYIRDDPTTGDSIIFSDSMASIMAIRSRTTRNDHAQTVQKLLIEINSQGRRIEIAWVKAHAGTEGNEKADYLAKDAETNGNKILIKPPLSFMKRLAKRRTLARWNRLWRTTKNGAWTREIFPTIASRLKTNISMDFVQSQFLTNHGKFNQYLHRMGIKRTNECKCGGVQDAGHLLAECPIFYNRRPAISTNIRKLLSQSGGIRDITSFMNHIHSTLVLWEREERRTDANN
ncbi:hypothetical protein BLOT_016631 [Blomia tropicalis]|nr:hypothetical protein BLOT_016631 [Blomia tropicalis]